MKGVDMKKSDEKILYIPDLIGIYNMTESAIRKHIQRGTGAIPAPMRIGARRLGWLRSDIDNHLAKLREKAA